jgi:hydroxymethylpyrimidine/phosphomethylpyrimidine kinase
VKILQDYAMQTALTIAGSDSSGGAGIQADLKTFAACGVYGLSAITAVTAQNTQGVRDMAPVAAEMVAAQIDAVAADFDVDATKIGMLATASIVNAVADAIARHSLKHVVLDPVLVSTSGRALVDAAGLDALRARLLPLATVVTPNLAEAAALSGLRVATLDDARRAAERIAALGPKSVVITGGHLDGPPVDVLWTNGALTDVPGDRVTSSSTHGTGCTFSAAIAARLALGDTIVGAVREAKRYVTRAIENAPGLGRGRGPLGH